MYWVNKTISYLRSFIISYTNFEMREKSSEHKVTEVVRWVLYWLCFYSQITLFWIWDFRTGLCKMVLSEPIFSLRATHPDPEEWIFTSPPNSNYPSILWDVSPHLREWCQEMRGLRGIISLSAWNSIQTLPM